MPSPTLQALILADLVHRDRETLKTTILGTFNELQSPDFPSTMDQLTYAFMQLTNVRGRVDIALRYVDLSDNKVLLECQGITISGRDPLATVEFAIQIPPYPMPHEGVYVFEVCANDDVIGAKRIRVTKREKKNGHR